jgi:WhiB family redox-sensing transcriptional regulator
MNGTLIALPVGAEPRPASVPIGVSLPCQVHDPGLWFSSVPADLNLAKAYCRGCRHRQPCLQGALERAEPAGVWGGEILEQGRIIEQKRPRGRPRKRPLGDHQG